MKRRSFFLTASGSIAALSGAKGYTAEKKDTQKKQQALHDKIKLKGVTWYTTRGYLPLIATSKRYEELHPGVEIFWERGYDFAQGNLEIESQTYDILMIDHPHVGHAAAKGFLVPLKDHLPEAYLKDQAENSVGKSHESYQYDGRQWGLATDAATPVAFYRPDILEEKGETVPKTWEDLVELAKKKLVVVDWGNINLLMNFYMMCVTMGGKLFQNFETVVDEETGVSALRLFRELALHIPSELFDVGNIYNAMTLRDDIAYCPFTYPYCNYSRRGFARKIILFTDLVSLGSHGMLHSTLGGAGLAVSAHSKHIETAVDYIAYATSPEIQSTIYFESGGQPGHRKAWLDDHVNALSNNFFKNTLKSHDQSYLRPRYFGYIYFQGKAGITIHEYVKNGGNEKEVLKEINKIYRESKGKV